MLHVPDSQEPQVLGRRAAAVPAEEPERASEWARVEEHFVTDGNRAGSRSRCAFCLPRLASLLN